MKKFHHLFLGILLVGCQTNQQSSVVSQAEISAAKTATEEKTIISFLGNELTPKDLSPEAREKLEKNLESANLAFKAYPDSLEVIIWYGRRLAYLGQHLEAIKVYSDGLGKFPNSYRLRRHRGHRYITTRKINEAIKDFELAAFQSTNAPNRIEPDGLPNKLNKPLGNDHFNIYYHFGLAHYLNGRFDKAVSAYNKCMEYSDNHDLVVATSYWLYMSAKRIGNDQLADEIIEKVSSRMKLVENEAYLDLLLLFKGEKSEDALLKLATAEDGGLNPTLSYGIGSWYLLNNRIDDARTLFWRTLESPGWGAFGYIATEAEINNMATSSN